MLLWRSGWRWWGSSAVVIGVCWALAVPPPTLLVTGDGRHVAVRGDHGEIALLRLRTGDYVRGLMAESSGYEGEPGDMDSLPGARCGPDTCVVDLIRGGRAVADHGDAEPLPAADRAIGARLPKR